MPLDFYQAGCTAHGYKGPERRVDDLGEEQAYRAALLDRQPHIDCRVSVEIPVLRAPRAGKWWLGRIVPAEPTGERKTVEVMAATISQAWS